MFAFRKTFRNKLLSTGGASKDNCAEFLIVKSSARVCVVEFEEFFQFLSGLLFSR